MPVDRGASSDERQRRALQGLSSSTGFIVGPGLAFNDDATELSVSLASSPDPSPGLRLYDTGLGLLLSPLSALRTRPDGAYLNLGTNSGLTVSAGALKVLLNPISPLLSLTNGLAVSSRVPRWVKVTLAHTAFQAAATTAQANLYSLPAGWVVLATKVKHSVAFGGTGILSYTVSVGSVGTPAKYAGAFSVFGAVTATNQQVAALAGAESHTGATQLVAQAVSTGANLDQSTGGSVDIWLLVGDGGA